MNVVELSVSVASVTTGELHTGLTRRHQFLISDSAKDDTHPYIWGAVAKIRV